MACCEMVNSQTSRCSLCLTLLRYLILSCLKFNIDLRCIHVPGKLNAKSDSLSHVDFQRFQRLAQDAEPYPNKLCEEIWSLSMENKCKTKSMRKQSLATYHQYQKFLMANSLEYSIGSYLLYLGYLVDYEYAMCTIEIKQYHLKFRLELNNLPDYGKSDRVKLFMQGLHRITACNPKRNIKLPISHEVLGKLIMAIPFCFQSTFEQRLVVAIVTTAFYGLCYIGELVMAMNEQTVVNRDDMVMGNAHFTFKVWNAQTAAPRQAQKIEIVETGGSTCPYQILKRFLDISLGKTGHLFVFSNGQPVHYHYFYDKLCTLLKFANVSPRLILTHSLWKGGACRLQELGASDQLIQAKGRWTSEAYKIYIAHQPLTSRKLCSAKFVLEPKLRERVEAIQGEADARQVINISKARKTVERAKVYQATKTYYYKGTRYVCTWFTHDAKKSKPSIRRKKLVELSHSKSWATNATKTAAVQTTSVLCRHIATQVAMAIGKHSATQVTAKDLRFSASLRVSRCA